MLVNCPRTSQKINTFSSDKIENIVKSEIDMVESGVGDLNVNLKVKSNSKSSVKEHYEAGDSRLQCHLLNSNDKLVSAEGYKEPLDKILKGKLSQKMKTKRPKSTTNTPEKSEIMKMFEKLQKKKAENRSIGSHNSVKTSSKNAGGLANSPPKSIIDTSTVTIVDQSPRLKPRNMSRFDALKSIFERQKSPNLDEKIYQTIVPFVRNIQKNSSSESTSKKNGEISSRIEAFSGLKSEYVSSGSSDLNRSRENADRIASYDRVVRLPNLGKVRPQSDKKSSSTSRKKRSYMSFKKQEEQNQMGSIEKFLIKKDTLPKNRKNEGESKSIE